MILICTLCLCATGNSTSPTELTASDLEILQDDQEWRKLWHLVGTGMDVDIESTVPLTRQQQTLALNALSAVIAEDTKRPIQQQFNEKFFVSVLNYILGEKDLYVLGYVSLAHHAMVRKPEVGAAMYNYLPFDKTAWDQLPRSAIVTTFYYKKEYEQCIKHAGLLQKDPNSTKVDRDYALTLELASRYRLNQPDACERIMRINAADLEPENNRHRLELYQQKCRSDIEDKATSATSSQEPRP